MKTFSGLAAIALLLGAVACGGSSKKALDPDLASGKKDRSGNMVAKAAEKGFNDALDDFAAQDRAASWNDATCDRVAKAFLAASDNRRRWAGKLWPGPSTNGGWPISAVATERRRRG